ncbi:MAG: TM2 domain-containing protein [Porphyromonas sp.]|nr:TM2 domain-containing protein [Porphyromonas sp.]
METEKVDLYIMSVAKYFDPLALNEVRQKVEALDPSKFTMLQTIEYREPTTMLLISLFGGSLGIDRFMLGQVGIGVAKLLTGGGCGIWSIIDWFLINRMTKEYNLEQFRKMYTVL